MSLIVLDLRPAVDARPPAEVWAGTGRLPAPPDQPPLRLVDDDQLQSLVDPPAPTRVPVSVDTVPAGVDPRLASELEGEARTWAPWFAQLLVEALDGRRPLESLGRWLDEWVLAEVGRRVRMQRRTRTQTPSPASPLPATVVSLRCQLTHRRALEISAHLRRGRRSSALAFQLVRSGERWRCAALQAE